MRAEIITFMNGFASAQPVVSIVMPTFNSADFVEKGLNSLLNQTYENLEIICVDDGSTDNTVDILDSICKKDPRVKVILCGENKGPAAARNTGMERARGKYIAFHDSDDFAFPHKITAQVKFMEKNPQIGLCGGQMDMHIYWNDNKIKTHRNPLAHKEILLALLLFRCPFTTPSVIIRKDIIDQYGLRYDENLWVGEDVDFYTKIISHTETCNLPDVLGRIYVRQDSVSRSGRYDGACDSAFKLACKEFNLTKNEADKISFLYRQDYNFNNTEHLLFLIEQFLNRFPDLSRKYVLKKVFRRARQSFKINLNDKAKKAYLWSALKYRTCVFGAVKFYFKKMQYKF